MQTKLTLRMDDKVVAKAKRIARKRHQSVSKMVEEHVNELEANDKAKSANPEIPSWVKQMKINPRKRRKGKKKSYDELKWEYLREKYLKD